MSFFRLVFVVIIATFRVRCVSCGRKDLRLRSVNLTLFLIQFNIQSHVVAQWRSGAVAQWRSGAVAQWRSGAVAQWRSGAVAQWRSGAMAQWLEFRTVD